MKGHTKIELKDVKTGEVEVFEEDNMVTNALQYFLASAGPYSANGGLTEDTVIKYPLWQTYVGGLLLFDKALEENAENVLPPAGVKMTGNGAFGVVNNADPTELGSYNANESGVQEDGSIRMVWDFTTSQANGTIACACLTSRAGGYIGTGNSTSKAYASSIPTVNGKSLSCNLFDGIDYSKYVENLISNKNAYNMFSFDYEDNSCFYIEPDTIVYSTAAAAEHWTSTGFITIAKVRVPYSAVDLHYTTGTTFPNGTAEPDIIEEYNVQIPEAVKEYISSVVSNNRWKVFSVGDTAYIAFYNENNIISAGNSFYVLKIQKQLESFATVLFQVTNTSTDNIVCGTWNSDQWFFVTSDEHLVVKRSDKNWLNINLTDSTDVEMIEIGEDITVSLIEKDKIYTSKGYIDTKLNSFSPINGSRSLQANHCFHLNHAPLTYQAFYIPYYVNTTVWRNCQYLATINNLEEPVVKTASKTMKVTYTITF